MLSYDFRQFCADSYVGNQEFDVDENYLLSPLFTPDRLLIKYPQTAIYVGEVDPLHDDALRFALRMK
jgi:acetyl esterase/lipase